MTLNDYIQEWSQVTYREGAHDCGLFIARWVDLQLGTDFAAAIKGNYRTVNEGLRKHAPRGIAARVAQELEQLNLTPTQKPKIGAIAVLENGFCALWDGEWCVGPILGMTGYCLIHKTHARQFYNLPKP